MSIERKANGFYEQDADLKLGRPRSLGVESSRVESCMKHYNEANFSGLFGSPHFGFHGENLDFIHQAIRKPSWLWFWEVNLKDVEALYELDELDCLGINSKRPGIDFSRFKKLGTVVNDWNKHDSGIANAAIDRYDLWHFKPRSKSFADVEIPQRVQQLELNWANPASLTGLPVLSHLTELQIHRCRNLEDLSALPHIAPNLRRLIITSSSRVLPEAGILDHPSLKLALINGKEVRSPNA